MLKPAPARTVTVVNLPAEPAASLLVCSCCCCCGSTRLLAFQGCDSSLFGTYNGCRSRSDGRVLNLDVPRYPIKCLRYDPHDDGFGHATRPQGQGLAQQLHIHPKALRSALRYLEQEQVVWREHRAFKRRRQGAADEEAAGARLCGSCKDWHDGYTCVCLGALQYGASHQSTVNLAKGVCARAVSLLACWFSALRLETVEARRRAWLRRTRCPASLLAAHCTSSGLVVMHCDGLLADPKAEASASVGDAVHEETDHPKGKLTFSFVCVDYARCVDAFQVLPCIKSYLLQIASTSTHACIPSAARAWVMEPSAYALQWLSVPSTCVMKDIRGVLTRALPSKPPADAVAAAALVVVRHSCSTELAVSTTHKPICACSGAFALRACQDPGNHQTLALQCSSVCSCGCTKCAST